MALILLPPPKEILLQYCARIILVQYWEYCTNMVQKVRIAYNFPVMQYSPFGTVCPILYQNTHSWYQYHIGTVWDILYQKLSMAYEIPVVHILTLWYSTFHTVPEY